MKNIIILVIVAALGAGAYFIFIDPDKGKELQNKYVKGYTEAKDPQKALDQFAKAIRERNYEAAATYVTSDYEAQLKKAAKDAQMVGKEIDALKEVMKNQGVVTSVGDVALLYIDPFPTELKFKDMKKSENEKTATAILYFSIEKKTLEAFLTTRFEGMSAQVRNVLFQHPTVYKEIPVKLKKVGEGDKAVWKIEFPKTPEASIDFFMKRASNIKNGLESVKRGVNTDATKREKKGFEKNLQRALEESASE